MLLALFGRIVVEAVLTFLLTIVLALSLLLHSWDESILRLWEFILLANTHKKISDVILVIIPVASLYIFTAAVFYTR